MEKVKEKKIPSTPLPSPKLIQSNLYTYIHTKVSEANIFKLHTYIIHTKAPKAHTFTLHSKLHAYIHTKAHTFQLNMHTYIL